MRKKNLRGDVDEKLYTKESIHFASLRGEAPPRKANEEFPSQEELNRYWKVYDTNEKIRRKEEAVKKREQRKEEWKKKQYKRGLDFAIFMATIGSKNTEEKILWTIRVNQMIDLQNKNK